MQRKKHVMTDLGRICNMLYVAESLPEYGKCTDILSDARKLLEQTMIELAKDKRSRVDWNSMSDVLLLLSRLWCLLKLMVLKDSSFCLYWMLYIYGLTRATRKAAENDTGGRRGQTERPGQFTLGTCSFAFNV